MAPGGKLMLAAVTPSGSEIQVGVPRQVLQARFVSALGIMTRSYDVTPDGKRFLVLTREENTTAVPITLVVNWDAGLKEP